MLYLTVLLETEENIEKKSGKEHEERKTKERQQEKIRKKSTTEEIEKEMSNFLYLSHFS